MKTLLILLLFTFSCYAGRPQDDDMPDPAQCPWCDDDDPEAPIDIDFADFALGCGFAVLVLRMYNAKNKHDEQIHLHSRN